VILAQEVESPVLAYHIVLTDIESDEPAARTYFIDAHTGEIALDFDSLHTAMEVGTGHSQYSGTVDIDVQVMDGGYGMTDENRGGLYTTDLATGSSGDGTLVTSSDLEFGDGTPSDPATAAVDAYYGAQMTWDYYKNTYGRSGLRDDNRGNLSRVHYSVGYVNAFWDDGCFCMTYGDGDNYYSTALTSLDVAGHEMTHGLTSVTAGLVYAFQPGGLNESMSDIFGTSVEFYAQEMGAQTVGDYYIGEDIWTPGTAGDALRYMDTPRKDGYSIDNASRYVPVMDVHYSSGVSNNVFFLASEGGTNSTSGKTVSGIGRKKVEAIFYRALTEYMTPWTNWKRARQVTQQAAVELYGQAESDGIGAAWDACGVR
jgi:Zn-dependent metalloprotease